MSVSPIAIEAVDGEARAGTVTTARGTFATPVFMPVGTRGSVKAVDARDLETLGASVVLGNTYHLMLRPGADVIAALGGLGAFSGWRGHTLTDSGGFQVFSLNPKVDDEGVTFRSTYDGSQHRLTPESAVATQAAIGADIQMVLDVCSALPAEDDVIRLAVERTAQWAERARGAARPEGQALFGIVQGGVDEAMRVDSARRTVALDFDGYGIGGLSVGESRADMVRALEATTPELPVDRPRYLMGVGDPIGMVEAIGRGVDMFDCVLPTRLARHGTALTANGRLQVRNAVHATSADPIDVTCDCPTCRRYSRGYLRHLLQVNEPSAARLVTLHNLAWVLGLMRRVREAIAAGRFAAIRDEVVDIWDRPQVK
ncbi:MAG TPA: tRNA guanosine(34) transglycosylase Tgt [Acidimicrobiales bacterium]|nr:tRNA guanosine(34) transglycosylase Tgt [Acidimicrobiales bacterium]